MAVAGKLLKRVADFNKTSNDKKGDPFKKQHKTFKKLIKYARNTELGKTYMFDQILTARYDIGLFQKLVPVHTYESIYKEWWKRMRRGDKDTCWPGKIKYFALSSGTTGNASKYIPVSKQMIKTIKKASMKQIFTMVKYKVPENTFTNHVLMIGGSTWLEEANGKYYGDMSGISAAFALPKWFIKQYYKPGYKISDIPEWNKRIDAIVKHAKDWNVSIICGIPNWVQLVIQKIIEHYNLKTIHDLWPNFNLYIHGGVFFDPYKISFRNLLARDIIYAETYMASEGYFGFTTEQKAEGIKLLLNNSVFYEFIDCGQENFDENFNVKPTAKALTIKDVKEGNEYAVLITNNSGAWRYLLGDTIRIVNKKDAVIKITGRTKHYLNDCGEHLSSDNIISAFNKVSKELDLETMEFTVVSIYENNRFHHKWFIAKKSREEQNEFAPKLDRCLKDLNDDYKTARTSTLDKPEIIFVSPKYFYDWLKFEGKEGNQFKIPIVMSGKAKESWMSFYNRKRKVKKGG